MGSGWKQKMMRTSARRGFFEKVEVINANYCDISVTANTRGAGNYLAGKPISRKNQFYFKEVLSTNANLGATKRLVFLGDSISVCIGPTSFSERFYFDNLVFGIAVNFSAVINPNKQRITVGHRISEERNSGIWYFRMTLCCATKQDRRLKRNWRFRGRLWKNDAWGSAERRRSITLKVKERFKRKVSKCKTLWFPR